MSYYQNPFDQEVRVNWMQDDHPITFSCPPNKNAPDYAIAWNDGPYDLSGSGSLTIKFAHHAGNFKNWSSLTINVAGATAAATTASEIAALLNANTTFSDHMTALLDDNRRLAIRGKKSKQFFKFYFANAGAELAIKFNKKAGVADLPPAADRHTIDSRFTYSDSLGMLVRLSHEIAGNTVANPTVVTSTAHGLTTGDVIYIVNSNSTPTIDGERTVTVTGSDTFTVPVNVTVAGTSGEWLSTAEKNIVADAGLTYSDMEDYNADHGTALSPAAAQAPAANTAAVLTLAADTLGGGWVLNGIRWSYSDTPTNGSLTIAWENVSEVYPVTSGGPGFLPFEGHRFPANTAVTITLAAGGGSVTGRVYATAYLE